MEQSSPPDKILVSVVIPTRNRVTLLQETIESLWKQTVPPRRFEIIVVDDRSTDGTAERIRRLQQLSPCRLVLYVMPEHSGPAPARNLGVRLAGGEIIAFIDSDCRADAHWLERGLAAFDDDRTAFVTGSFMDKPEQPVTFFSKHVGKFTLEHPTYPTMNAFFRRSLFVRLGGFDEQLSFPGLFNQATECADTDLAWRCKKQGHTNRFDPALIVYHEVARQTPFNWLVEPIRLFIVPELVRRHPELRTCLLKWRYFFCKENALFLMAAVGGLGGLLAHPLLFGLVAPYVAAWPYLWWSIRFNKGPVPPADLLTMVPETILLAARHMVMCASLLYGSVRFRCVVL